MNDVFSPKERLLRTLNGEGADRAPVICPGGMMNAAIVDVMQKTGSVLPDAHHSAGLMAELARDVSAETGFENFGLPFCMTIEAEALGSGVDYGSLKCEPKITKEPFLNAGDVRRLPTGTILKNKRAAALLNAVHELSVKTPDVPVVGSVTGPVSLAASLVDPMTFFKDLRKNREASHRLLDYVTEQLIDYVKGVVESGATVVSIADPTATGEILGPALFEEYALPSLNRIVDAVDGMGAPVIIHICGDVKTIKRHFPALRGKAISVDAMVNLQELKGEFSSLTTMGNLSTYMLEFSNAERICRATESLLQQHIDIISPACGLSTSTPLANITAFTHAVKGA
jgi:[methyl-Co(III) methanol-specific corrinoid protein]:coenzyme M methyltransferase